MRKRIVAGGIVLVLALVGMVGLNDTGPAAADITVSGDWQVTIAPGIYKVGPKSVRVEQTARLKVDKPQIVSVTDEYHKSVPLFNPDVWGWAKGVRLMGLRTEETSAAGLLIPGSVVVKSGPGRASKYEAGKDYAIDETWASFGTLTGGMKPGSEAWVDYKYSPSRIDSIAVDKAGRAELVKGKPHVATPEVPSVVDGRVTIANVWVPGMTERLGTDSIYRITEPEYVHTATVPAAKELLPKTWAKLTSGKELHILAWGDSVTAGGTASSPHKFYQARFVEMLGEAFPKAKIKLTTVAWGGRNTAAFLAEPPGSEYNFEEKVIGARPDLIVMEFVNDAALTPAQVEDRYSHLLKRFNEIGAEWAIITPHYVRPDWMNSKTDRIESDPRPYVLGLRQFSKKHKVALADASLRWGHLAKEGIPYTTLLVNSINHPNDRGHQMFADALMDLFRTGKAR